MKYTHTDSVSSVLGVWLLIAVVVVGSQRDNEHRCLFYVIAEVLII